MEYNKLKNGKGYLRVAAASLSLISMINGIMGYADNYVINKKKDRIENEEETRIVQNFKKQKTLTDLIEESISNNKRIESSVINGYDLTYLVKSMIDIESSGRKDAVSNQGAVGLMQITDRTRIVLNKNLGKNYTREDMKNVHKNLEYGIHHFLDKYEEFKNKREEDKILFAIAGYIGVPKKIRSKEIKTWKQAVNSIDYWHEDNHGTNAKIYVAKVLKKYSENIQEKYQFVRRY